MSLKSISIQSFMTSSRKSKRIGSISVARMDRLCSYLEQDNDALQEGIEELNNKLEQMCNKYDELLKNYAILQKENEELKNKSNAVISVPVTPVPTIEVNKELEEEEYISEDSNQPEKSKGTGNPADKL